jgi:O-antigen/teichoic acid export membrane protein
MSQIRKKSLKASAWIYGGFLIGAVNTWFFAHKGWFTPDQYGLTRVMIEIGSLFFAFSTLGVTSYLYKFFPYYEDNTDARSNDILGVALVVAMIGFALTVAGALLFEPLIVQKFSENSRLLVDYFYWTLPMAFFILLYNVLESYSYGFKKGVIASLLKETVLRVYVLAIIAAKVLQFISFKTFMMLFAFQYAIIVAALVAHLIYEKKLWLSFKPSRVTIKFRKKIVAIMALTFIVIVVSVLRQSIDGLVLAAKKDLGKVGVFGFAAYMVSVLQAPFRSIVAITIPILARAWKDKQYGEIERIYKRSSINLLSFSLFIFFCIWLNYTQAIPFFGINPDYLEGRWVFFLLGMVTIIEMGTGVNAQIIGTSTYWRFELWTSLLLTALIIPLSYWLTVKYGIIGPAVANIVSFSVYNFIRFWFLWKKFNMQPFTVKTVEVIIISVAGYFVIYWLLGGLAGLVGLVLRTALFSMIFIAGLYWRKITPDFMPVMNNLLKRVGVKQKED